LVTGFYQRSYIAQFRHSGNEQSVCVRVVFSCQRDEILWLVPVLRELLLRADVVILSVESLLCATGSEMAEIDREVSQREALLEYGGGVHKLL
jgi:hypothetical protein